MLHPVLRLIAFIILALTGAVRVVASESFTTLHVFNGASTANFPSGGAMLHNGVIYGTTRGNSTSVFTGQGSLWGFDLGSGQFTTLHQFDGPGDGRSVNSSLAVIGSRLYGTTAVGGAADGGVLWSYDLNGGGYQSEFEFDDSSGELPTAIIAVNDKLVGALERDASLWSFDPSTDEYQTLHSLPGLNSPNSLIAVGNRVYGTSLTGPGIGVFGGLWCYDLQTGAYKLLHGMDRHTEGRFPSGGLLEYNGSLYGTNGWGPTGSIGGGVLWKYDLASDAFSVLYVVKRASDGITYPLGEMQLLGDKLVGTAMNGGNLFGGAIWTFNLQSNELQTIHDFSGPGTQPAGIDFLYQGKFYGTSTGEGVGGLWSFAVPEPSASTLASACLLILGACRPASAKPPRWRRAEQMQP